MLMQKIVAAGGLSVALAFAPWAAKAQATPEGADQIRQGLKGYIATRLLSDDGLQVAMNGAIEVRPEGAVYQATLPQMTVTFAGDTTIGIDPIRITLTPTQTGMYKAVWTLPSSYEIRSADPADGATITIGSQSGTGLFAPQYEQFLDMNAALNQVRIAPTDGQGEFVASQVKLVSDSTERSPNVYDNAGTVSFDGISVRDETGAEVMKLGSMAMDIAIKAGNLAAMTALQGELRAFKARHQADPAGEMSPEAMTDLSTLIAGTPRLFDTGSMNFTFADLAIDSPEARVTLATFGFGYGLSGLETGSSDFRIHADLAGLGVDPLPPAAAVFVPKTADIDVTLENLPNEGMVEILTGFLQSMAAMGPDQAGTMAMLQLQQVLMGSGGALKIAAIRADTGTVGFDLGGALAANPQSPFMVAGQASMTVTGLEQAMAALQAVPDGQEALQGLTVLQTMGAQTTDAAGRPARKYDLTIGENGDLLLNGTDLKPLLGGL
jgi:hypothetical protein